MFRIVDFISKIMLYISPMVPKNAWRCKSGNWRQ